MITKDTIKKVKFRIFDPYEAKGISFKITEVSKGIDKQSLYNCLFEIKVGENRYLFKGNYCEECNRIVFNIPPLIRVLEEENMSWGIYESRVLVFLEDRTIMPWNSKIFIRKFNISETSNNSSSIPPYESITNVAPTHQEKMDNPSTSSKDLQDLKVKSKVNQKADLEKLNKEIEKQVKENYIFDWIRSKLL